jgi:uncharacterized protein
MNKLELKDKIALITGASSGIGEEFARQLHALGVNLILVARRKNLLDELARELNLIRENSTSVVSVDLTDEKDRIKLIEFCRDVPIDILINNAGRGSFGRFEKLPLNEELYQVELNIVATLSLLNVVIPYMKKRNFGVIISISSISGFQPLPFMSTYAATKAFNLSHTLALREELKSFGIKVLAVCPGPVATEFAGVARVPGEFTGLPRSSAYSVVKSSINALLKEKPWIIPTFRAKLLALPSLFLSRTFTTFLAGFSLRNSLKAVEEGKYKRE